MTTVSHPTVIRALPLRGRRRGDDIWTARVPAPVRRRHVSASRLPARRPLQAILLGVIAATTVLASAISGSATSSPGSSSTGATNLARARVAADVLMQSYDPAKAWWPSSWWNSAVAMQTIGDYMQRTGDRRFVPEMDNTFEKDKGVFPPGVLSGDPLLGNFTSRAIDDSEWWGLT